MKLLIDCTPLRSGGGVQCAVALIEGLRGRSDVHWKAVVPDVMRPSAPSLFTLTAIAKGEVITIPKQRPTDLLRAARTLGRIERAFAPDVVYTVFGPAYFHARAPHLVGFALPNLIYERDGPLADSRLSTKTGDSLRRIMVRRADHHVVETETVANRLASRLGIERKTIDVIGNSVNPLLALQSVVPVRAPDLGRIKVLVPSAYYPHKNLEVMPAVAAALRNIAPALSAKFQLTLDPASSAWRRLAAQAADLGVADCITTLGVLPMEPLAQAYANAQMVLLPTLREASTAVYPEAFHFRRPLLTSDIDFARELCGDAALFVPPVDPLTIARAIATVATDPALAERLVMAGTAQLAAGYPTPARKLEMQLNLLNRLASHA